MRSVRIDHAVYTVKFEDTEEMTKLKGTDEEVAGQINQAARTIHIAPEYPDEFKIQTIWHEIIHGIWYSWGIDGHPENLINLFASTIVAFIRENQNYDVMNGFFFRNLFFRASHKEEDGTFVNIDNLNIVLGRVHPDRKAHQLWTTIFYIAMKEAGFEVPENYLQLYRTLGFEMPRFVTHPNNVWLVDATVGLALPVSTPAAPPTPLTASEKSNILSQIDVPGGGKLVVGGLFHPSTLSSKAPETE